jgi:hypothetical protein
MLALGMNKGTTENAKRNGIHTWHAWIWEELSAGNDQEAHRLLLSIERMKPLSEEEFIKCKTDNIQFLKSYRHLEHRAQQTLAQNLPGLSSIYTDLLALLMYLSVSPRDLNAPLELHLAHIKAQSSHFSSCPAVVELAYTRLHRLLYHHATTSRPFRPALLRTHLETALTIYPHNTHFLSLYAWNEARTKIENRIRGVLLQRDAGPVEWWLFAVWIEMRMSRNYNVYAVRNLFERATTQHKGSVVLWLAWIVWEVSRGETSRAKEIWRKAWRECVWSKGLALAGLKLGLEKEEMGRVVGIVAEEKGLRVHDIGDAVEAAEMAEALKQLESEERG